MIELYRRLPAFLFIIVSIVLAVAALFFEDSSPSFFLGLRLASFIIFMLGLMKLFGKK